MGRTIQRSTGTDDKLKAQEYHDRLKVALWEEKRLGRRPRQSWRNAAGRWLHETSDKRTHRGDESKLKRLHPILGSLMLDEVTLSVIDQIRVALRQQDLSQATVNRYLALVRSILHRARDEWDWLETVPKVKLYKESMGRERSLTPNEASRLLAELPEHQREMALFALMTGLRQANVMGLEWQQVNFDLRHAYVPAWKAKNGHSLSVPLNAGAMDILGRMQGRHPTRVFTYKGRPVNAVSTKAWRRAVARAGLEDFRWHDLRHTWATWQRQAGTPTYELQRLGGWRTGAMVERYAHIAPEQLAGAAARLDGLLPSYDFATATQ
jgi:integrase